MNKSSHYDQQQTEPKQCKSEVEKFTYSPKPGNWPASLYLKISTSQGNSGFHTRENFFEETILYLKVVKLGSYIHEIINF